MTYNKNKRPITISRQELYERVWQTPMFKLASQYGISDNGLAKICRRLEIPYPKRGYWAKVAAGKKATKTKLKSPSDNTPLVVEITPSQKKTTLSEATNVLPTVAEKIVIPKILTYPHPIIKSWIEKRELELVQQKSRDADLYALCPSVYEFTDTERRMHCVLDTLFKELERRDIIISEGEKGVLIVDVGGQQIEFTVYEKRKQSRRTANKIERVMGQSWRQELLPTGNLTFVFRTYLRERLRQNFVENEKKRMEDLLPEIIEAVSIAAIIRDDWDKEEEIRLEQFRLKENQKQQEFILNEKRKNQWKLFLKLSKNWEEYQTSIKFLDDIKSLEVDSTQQIDEKSLAEWIIWAEENTEQLNPLRNGVADVFKNVSSAIT